MRHKLLTLGLIFVLTHSVASAVEPQKRTPWTTPYVTGSPEPPPAYKSVRVFPKVQFKNPVAIEMPPGDARWWVAEPEGKLSIVTPTDDGGRADLITDFKTDLKLTTPEGDKLRCGYIYGIAFHPKFEQNHQLFLAYTVVSPKPGVHLEDGTRVSRFLVTPGVIPKIDFGSEELLITFREGGHNGACLDFGPEGDLYISTGDAGDASPPDMHNTGQDNTDLLCCILRIDVDHRDPGKNYAIPKDNPFVDTPDFRPEIWAYGFRNPWKMSFDRATGDLWVGDIGWELWEMVHRVERGANYGWSVMEGPQPVRVELAPGPQPITAPLLALPHTAAASITGGFVYRGRKFPELRGKYVFGDWETHRIWALDAPARGDSPDAKPLTLTELTLPSIRIIDFGQDHDGELVIMDYDDGTIHTLDRNNQQSGSSRPFPTKLSDTGLFKSVPKHELAPGVVPFQIAAEQWLDGVTAQRSFAVPGDDVITAHRIAKQTPGSMFRRHFEFPKDSVLVKTLSLPEDGSGKSPRRIETQLLHFDGYQWQAYTYRWNDEQTDGQLVPAEGDEAAFTVADKDAPGGSRTLHWTFASRSQCITCHTPWAESTLAFSTSQLLKPLGSSATGRLDEYELAGLLTRQSPAQLPKNLTRWDEESVVVPPFDEQYSLDERARSYLDANCSHCHRFGGGGTAQIDLRAGIPLARTKTINEIPTKGNLELNDARIIVPGNPWRSVLFLRMATCGRGRMPHLASEVVDQRGLALIEKWIRTMPSDVVPAPASAGSASSGGLSDESSLETAMANVAASTSAEARRRGIDLLLGDRAGALFLARALDSGRLPVVLRTDVIAAVTASPNPAVRDLFTIHLPAPPADRVGQVPRPRLILSRTGDADRGKSIYQTSMTLNCKVCHKIGSEGGQVGPDLTQIARRRRRDELLDSLVNPSSVVDPRFAAYVVELKDGRVVTGVVTSRTSSGLELRDAKGDLHKVEQAVIEQLRPQRVSLMPEGLLKDLTLQDAADLLAYLESLK
ncbi:MAG TPA: PQQ-dependent sugar dehydrogenase [Caulifigura sp.]|nr:PQQ-dependent sugar dehydrogenase [Caulifigura sp.]